MSMTQERAHCYGLWCVVCGVDESDDIMDEDFLLSFEAGQVKKAMVWLHAIVSSRLSFSSQPTLPWNGESHISLLRYLQNM